MNMWKRLDLRCKVLTPTPGELVALRLEPTNGISTVYRNERFDIGRFEADARGGRKVWFHSSRGTEDPVRLRKHYDIGWCPIPHFDGF